MSTHDPFSRRARQGRLVSLDDVFRTGRYASHCGVEGHLYEFDEGRLWRTDLHAQEHQRVLVEDGPDTPLGPWYHRSICDCELCVQAPGERA